MKAKADDRGGFAIGDEVKMRNGKGAPVMTIVRWSDEAPPAGWICQWWVQSALRSGFFVPAALRRVEPAAKD
jgi:hypothetical protein